MVRKDTIKVMVGVGAAGMGIAVNAVGAPAVITAVAAAATVAGVGYGTYKAIALGAAKFADWREKRPGQNGASPPTVP